MSTELVTKNDELPRHRDELSELQRLGKMFAASGYFSDVKDLAQACVKILAGKELGFSPFASITGVYLVKGKPSLSANLMASAIVRAGYRYQVHELTNDVCEIEFFDQKDRSLGISTFTMKDGIAAGTASNEVWKKYPRNMLFARAMSNGARWFCAGAFGGQPVYTPEELGVAVDGEGSPVIEHKPQTNGNAPPHEVVFTPGTKPQSEKTNALQAKLDAKKNGERKEVTTDQVVSQIPLERGDSDRPLFDDDFDLVPGDRD